MRIATFIESIDDLIVAFCTNSSGKVIKWHSPNHHQNVFYAKTEVGPFYTPKESQHKG